MRNKAKVEKVLSFLSHEDQRFATLFGPKALENRAVFELAREVHYDVKNDDADHAASNLLMLFTEAIEKSDFSRVRQFVELLDDWTAEAVEILDGTPGMGFSMPFAKDPVGMALLTCAEVPVQVTSRPADDDISAVKLIRMDAIGHTAREILEWLKIKAPDFRCDVKTIRNRARDLGVKLLPDRRGLRQGQKRKHVHRARA